MLRCVFLKVFFIYCGLIFFISISFANEVLPKGCIAIVVKGDYVNLKADKNMFIFVHNLSQNNVWLVNNNQTGDLYPSFSGRIDAGSWSALGIREGVKDLKINCVESTPGHEQRVACEEVLAICNWPHTKISEDRKGIYFVAENMDLSSLRAYSERNGYSLS